MIKFVDLLSKIPATAWDVWERKSASCQMNYMGQRNCLQKFVSTGANTDVGKISSYNNDNIYCP